MIRRDFKQNKMIASNLRIPSNRSVIRLNYILLFISTAYLLYGFLAPFIYYLKIPYLEEYYRIGKSLCVQRPSRCFWYLDERTALCSKCLGLYFGVAFASLCIVLKKIDVYKINKFMAISFLTIFILMVTHSTLRSIYGWLLLPVSASFIFGMAGGYAFAIIISYLILKVRRLAMLFSGKR